MLSYRTRPSLYLSTSIIVTNMPSSSRPPRPPPPAISTLRSPPPDELDSVVNLETAFHSEGVASAYTSGASLGRSSGRSLGWRAGVALTSELEFYRGAATALLALREAFAERVPAKAEASARKLLATAEAVHLGTQGNDKTIDMDAHKEQLRRHFRQMTAFAGLSNVRFDLTTSKMSELDF